MGKRGPAKTPTAVLKIRDSWRAKTRDGEPEPSPGLPECPAWLRDKAKLAWGQLVPLLDDMGVLFRVDEKALARYCELWARWLEASQWIQANGEVWEKKDEEGNLTYAQQYPQVGIVNKLGEQLARLESQFGMTPSARAGLTVDNDKNKTKGKPAQGKSRFFA